MADGRWVLFAAKSCELRVATCVLRRLGTGGSESHRPLATGHWPRSPEPAMPHQSPPTQSLRWEPGGWEASEEAPDRDEEARA